MATLELKLSDRTSIFADVEPVPGSERYEDLARSDSKLEADFEKFSASLKEVVESIEAQLSQLIRRPDEMQIEMGVALKGEANFWIVKGETSGHMKVTLTWRSASITSP